MKLMCLKLFEEEHSIHFSKIYIEKFGTSQWNEPYVDPVHSDLWQEIYHHIPDIKSLCGIKRPVTFHRRINHDKLGTMWASIFNQLPDKSMDECNTLMSDQNGRHLADNSFNYIFLNKNLCILIKISLKCISKGPINHKSAMIHVMACHQTSHYLDQCWPRRLTPYIHRLVQEWRNSTANALELRLSCTNPSISSIGHNKVTECLLGLPPLAWLAVLLALGFQAMWYIQLCHLN